LGDRKKEREEIIQSDRSEYGKQIVAEIELLDLNKSSIHVAEYWTELPSKDMFEKKIRKIVERSKEKVARSQAAFKELV